MTFGPVDNRDNYKRGGVRFMQISDITVMKGNVFVWNGTIFICHFLEKAGYYSFTILSCMYVSTYRHLDFVIWISEFVIVGQKSRSQEPFLQFHMLHNNSSVYMLFELLKFQMW